MNTKTIEIDDNIWQQHEIEKYREDSAISKKCWQCIKFYFEVAGRRPATWKLLLANCHRGALTAACDENVKNLGYEDDSQTCSQLGNFKKRVRECFRAQIRKQLQAFFIGG